MEGWEKWSLPAVTVKKRQKKTLPSYSRDRERRQSKVLLRRRNCERWQNVLMSSNVVRGQMTRNCHLSRGQMTGVKFISTSRFIWGKHRFTFWASDSLSETPTHSQTLLSRVCSVGPSVCHHLRLLFKFCDLLINPSFQIIYHSLPWFFYLTYR